MQSGRLAVHDTPEYVGSTLSVDDVDEVFLICQRMEASSTQDWSMLLMRLGHADYRVVLVLTEGGGRVAQNARVPRRAEPFVAVGRGPAL